MQWLNKIVDELEKRHPDGEILVESGASPSGTYHFGHMREIITCDAIVQELKKRGRSAKHIHFVDDLDALRKIPANIPKEYEKYLGQPLCDIPAPDESDRSYANFFLDDFLESAKTLGIDMEVVRSHEKYRAGFFVPAIEKVLDNLLVAKRALEDIAGRKLDDSWSPIQIMEDNYLKNRRFVSLDKKNKTINYLDKDDKEQTVGYDEGSVKLDWRFDWPARWWLLNIHVEPAGRDHSTRGGSFDTGLAILKNVYESPELLPVPYDFVNLAGDPKKMSASRGTGIGAAEIAEVLPPEVARFFMLRFPPSKRLYFDQVDGTVLLVDEFAALSAKDDKSPEEVQLLHTCTAGLNDRTVSRIPFSHLVASYQAALKDTEKTLEVIGRTEHKMIVEEDKDIIKNELKYIEAWLKHWAPDDVKFDVSEKMPSDLSDQQKKYLGDLAAKIEDAPEDADGEWFHKAIYEFKESSGLEPKELFVTLYRVLIDKESGPRAGWFLSILPRGWLVKRLKLEN